MEGASNLNNCLKCGCEATILVKTWAFSSRKSIGGSEESKLFLGIFECAKCKTRFRAVVESEKKLEFVTSIKDMVDTIISIRDELVQALKALRKKIMTLESERSNLLLEIEKQKKTVGTKASVLEREVKMLRKDVKTLKELLSYTKEKEN